MRKVLIVDDETSFTRLLALNLEESGDYEVRVENVSANATKAAGFFKPDVAILDVLMPGKSGIKIAEEWGNDESLSKIPVIFLTAAMSKDTPMMEGGVLDKFPVLIKPVSFSDLLQQLDLTLA